MSDRDEICIKRIAEELEFIQNSIKNTEKNIFLNDKILQHAIKMSLIVIGENVNHLSEKFKKMHKEIEWDPIIAVRNMASHGYWQLNMEQIWKAIETDIPNLKTFFDEL
jgi:uncharacterized protein with HEPN domain